MQGKDRMMMALDRREPDRVPLWELAFNESSILGIAKHFMDPAGLPQPKLVMDMTDAERLSTLSALVTFIKELDVEGITAIGLVPRERLDQTHMRDDMGVVHHLSEVGEPMPIDGPVRDKSDLKNYRMRKPADEDFLMLDVLKGALPDRAVAFDMQATFKLSWALRGAMEKLLVDYITDPALAHDLARMTTDYCLEVVDAVCDRGADFIVMDGDLAFNQGPLMSPSHYNEFIGPYHEEICKQAHKRGKKIIKHSDGNLTPLVPSLIEAGFDGIHPIQPQCMDIGETKQKFGDRLCILGNIDCSYLLVFEGPEEVREAVRRTIEAAAPGGGYVLSSSNTIHPGVKPENYLAMVSAAREFGGYPDMAA